MRGKFLCTLFTGFLLILAIVLLIKMLVEKENRIEENYIYQKYLLGIIACGIFGILFLQLGKEIEIKLK